jgi:carbonic anhydrase
MEAERPGFFTNLSHQQNPRYMWIGCSDSRVPANQITGLEPGEVFVHRNVANLVVPTDLNCLSTIQYAVDQLKVEHLMVVGHYGCGGVLAALNDVRIGLADNWLRQIKDVAARHRPLLNAAPERLRADLLLKLFRRAQLQLSTQELEQPEPVDPLLERLNVTCTPERT